MRLLEAIVQVNHRAAAGEPEVTLDLTPFADSLPLVALTCIDPRLNRLLPGMLGIPEEAFLWLRNAGNILTGPLSSTMRSLAFACAIKGGREIVILGHTDCKAGQTTALMLLENLAKLGVQRSQLPDNLNEYFGLFASERQNVHRGVSFVRSSPLIGPRVPVHGLLIDVKTGRVDWIDNGYEALDSVAGRITASLKEQGTLGALAAGALGVALNELSTHAEPIGDITARAPESVATPPSATPPEPRPTRPSAPPLLGLPKSKTLHSLFRKFGR